MDIFVLFVDLKGKLRYYSFIFQTFLEGLCSQLLSECIYKCLKILIDFFSSYFANFLKMLPHFILTLILCEYVRIYISKLKMRKSVLRNKFSFVTQFASRQDFNWDFSRSVHSMKIYSFLQNFLAD